jgi:hypothetical protein
VRQTAVTLERRPRVSQTFVEHAVLLQSVVPHEALAARLVVLFDLDRDEHRQS